ncbi:MAG: hypothetical protein CML93_03175 [Rhodobiaceae bacterium]|nr:hypothetical protein [Rhodobiaceae bacterium]|tara:strand:+ start:384 stop:1070 length:687 start_codon:yes stop_codon:yes gene_type:complete
MIKKLFWYLSWNIRGKSDHATAGVGRGDLNENQLKELALESISLLGLNDNDVLLDIGCAQGYLTNIFSQKIKKAIGIDISSSSIEKAKTLYKANKKIHFSQCKDEPSYNYEKENFSKIVCIDVVQYFTNDKQFNKLCSEIYRMLKPGGKALIGGIRIKKDRENNENKKFTRTIRTILGKELAYLMHRTYTENYLTSVAKENKFEEFRLTKSEYYPGYFAVNLFLKKQL